MDFLVSSANISFSVKLAHPTQLAHPAHPAQLAHPAQPAHPAQWAHQISRIFGYHEYPRRRLTSLVMGLPVDYVKYREM